MMKSKDAIEQGIHAVATAPVATIPPASVAAATFLGYTPSEWLVWLSISWILIQAVFFIIDRVIRFRKHLGGKDESR